jgi:hypothetical protein
VPDQPAPPRSPGPGLVQSLLIKSQRVQLDAIGAAVGTPVLYLKAAWSDPVLYGGRGERTGSDIDVLVHPDRFRAFAAVLEEKGFHRLVHPSPSYERYFGHKEWAYFAPKGLLSVDLHRALTEPVWYHLHAADLIARARAWDSVDGPILSLDPEDQLLYGAAHYANHLYDAIDERHLGDCDRLVQQHPIDWTLLWQRAQQTALTLPLALLMDALVARGRTLDAAALGPRSLVLRVRQRLADHFVTPQLGRRRPRSRLDHVVLRPLLSDDVTALPRMVVSFGIPWVVERLRGAHRPHSSR